MTDTLVVSLLACFIGAAVAGLFTALPIGRRIPVRVMGWLLAIAPAIAFAALASQAPAIATGKTLTWAADWMPTLGLGFSLTLDGLSALMGLLVTGIGVLVVIYAGYYFGGSHPSPLGPFAEGEGNKDARFFFYILLFMTAMLGLVLAGDIITLFLFWEGTSITSFLLIAYRTKDEEARKGAFKALFITGGGGIALLAGLLFVSGLAGGATDLAAILKSGDVIRASPWYPVALGLIAFGAFTKSAQVPLHFWLPTAMSAPTPASAYLHSATMVKAGVYLLARFYPALGGTELWFWLLVAAGALTMITGAVIGLRQIDLKAVLAYSTISQLGVLVMLIGLSTSEAFIALFIGILAHALYKGALFLVVGIVDHETGTRDLRKLGGLWRAMPATFIIGGIAALSMAGLPPLLGFLSKETSLAAVTESHLSSWLTVVLPMLSVAVGALMLAQAGTLILDTFVTRPGAGFPASMLDLPLTDVERDDDPEDLDVIDRSPPKAAPSILPPRVTRRQKRRAAPAHAHVQAHEGGQEYAHSDEHAHQGEHHPHEPLIGMLVGPAVLAGLSLLFVLTSPPILTDLLAQAAAAAYGGLVKVSLDLWHGINLPLILSAIAIGLGVVLFLGRSPYRGVGTVEALTMDRVYEGVLHGFDRAAALVTRTQAGRIRFYLAVMLIALFALVAVFGGLVQVLNSRPLATLGARLFAEPLNATNGLRAFSLLLAVAASFVSIVIRRDLFAIVALGSSGLAVAVLIALEPSPDVALVQVIVDILSTVVLVLALARLPRAQRARAEALNTAGKTDILRNAMLAAIGGLMVFMLCLYDFASRPRESIVTPYYERNSKPLTGAADIVGAIVVDFRGFDTMIEITVFSVAGIGVYTLLRYAMKKREQISVGVEDPLLSPPSSPLPSSITGIDGVRTSPFVHALAYAALPLTFVLAFVQMIYGHDQPGDGFTAGVTLSLGIGFWYVVFGYDQTKQRLNMIRPGMLIGAGILTVMIGSILPVFLGGAFFSPFDFGHALGLPLPEGFDFSTSFLFEIAICLAVLGAAMFIIDTLGHPERDLE